MGLWIIELTAGSIGFLWAAAATTGKRVRIGTFDQFLGKHPGLPIVDGFRATKPRRARSSCWSTRGGVAGSRALT
jgi:hypothetical protein